MGCSPSKGKLFSKPEGTGPDNTPLSEGTQDCIDSAPIQEESRCLENNEKENEPPVPTEEYSMKEATSAQLASITSFTENVDDIKETEVNMKAQEIITEPVQTVQVKKTEKRKKIKGQRRSSGRQKPSIFQAKLDFPPHMARAHQAAYAFLNPNISKYETLLDLLDQAAQTQLSLQPMMSALVLRFEEINQGLEEMAEEGELMLKEHGDYMALPSGMMGPVIMHAKATISPPDPPPDLLQQLLQHSTEKMRLVSGSVQALGDTTLEEAVEYFSLLSKLLAKKLQVKQAAERKLAQVLARVEGAAMRKSNPEDSALHSEDSGIGGENESLTGSERHRHHRGSAGSGSCGSGTNVRNAFDALSSNLPNLVDHNEDGEEEEEGDDDGDDDDDDDDEYMDEEGHGPARKRSNSSPPDPSQALTYLRANYMRHQQPRLKRPMTAAISDKVENSASTKHINILTELQNSQRDLDQRIKKMTKATGNKELAGPHFILYRSGLRRHSLSSSAIAQKESLNQSPGSLPRLTAQQTKRHSVRRLINTFSHGVDGRPGQTLAHIPPHIIRSRKCGLPQLTDTVNGSDRGVPLNGNQNNNIWPDGRDDMDVDNLPPPPPEVLMDNSFQSSEGLPGNEARSTKDSVRTLPSINQRTGVSQRLKASMQNVELLPSRTIVRPKLIGNLPDHPIRQDALMGMQDQQADTDHDPETKTNSLYQQARKIIHLRNAAENPNKARLGQRCESTEFHEAEMSSSCLPVTAPPVSRVRLPPSCPTVCHRYPTPPMGRPQTNSRPSSRPGSPRTVTRATDNSSEEIIPSVSFKEARSVFCQKESQNSQPFISAGNSVLPRPWAEGSRGRLPMRRIDNTTRRTQSEQRPGLPTHSEFSKDGS